MNSVSSKIRQLLAKDGRSRYAIAEASGISEGQLSRFVRGERGLSADTLESLAKHLGYEIVLRPLRKRRKGN